MIKPTLIKFYRIVLMFDRIVLHTVTWNTAFPIGNL